MLIACTGKTKRRRLLEDTDIDIPTDDTDDISLELEEDCIPEQFPDDSFKITHGDLKQMRVKYGYKSNGQTLLTMLATEQLADFEKQIKFTDEDIKMIDKAVSKTICQKWLQSWDCRKQDDCIYIHYRARINKGGFVHIHFRTLWTKL